MAKERLKVDTVSVSVCKLFENPVFPAGALTRAFEEIHTFLGYQLTSSIHAEYRLDNHSSKSQVLKKQDLDTVVAIGERLCYLAISFSEDILPKYTIAFTATPTGVVVAIHAEAINESKDIIDILSTWLDLHEIDPDSAPILQRPIESALISVNNSEVDLPDKVTLKWLYHHVPIGFWIFLASLLATVFGVGFTVSKFIG